MLKFIKFQLILDVPSLYLKQREHIQKGEKKNNYSKTEMDFSDADLSDAC